MRININWEVRIKNKNFWMFAIPALFLVIQALLACFGIDFDFTIVQERILNLVNAVFAFLTIIGIVNDPTTKGISDSEQAMTYALPKDDSEMRKDEEV